MSSTRDGPIYWRTWLQAEYYASILKERGRRPHFVVRRIQRRGKDAVRVTYIGFRKNET
jgi:hypothetical protein